MDAFKIANGIEELIYDVMLWIIFYPYTLARVVLRPLGMMHYVRDEIGRPVEEQFANSISPPLFLFLSILLGWLIVPIDPELAKRIDAESVAMSPTLKLATESLTNLIVYRVAVFCSFPLLGALIFEWRTPGGITRETFRAPVYQQCYITAPMALLVSSALTELALVGNRQDELARAAIWLLIGLASMGWAVTAQYRFFRHIAGCTIPGALLWAIVAIFGGFALLVGTSWF